MEKSNSYEYLVSVGISSFTDYKEKICDEISSQNIPLNNAVISTATAEALIRAVATMIKESNSHQ